MNASIKVIDKEIAACETFLSKVLKRNIKQPRGLHENKQKSNASRKRDAQPFLTGPTSSRQYHSSATHRLSRTIPEECSPWRTKSTIQREHFMANNTNLTAMPTRNNSQRRRSHSSGQVLTSSRTDHDRHSKLADLTKQTKSVFEPLRSTRNRDASCNRISTHASREHSSRHKRSPRTRYVTWDEDTKENHTKGGKTELSKDSHHKKSQHRKASKSVVNTRPMIRSSPVHKDKHHRQDMQSVTSEDSVISGNSSTFDRAEAVEHLKKLVNLSVPKDIPKHLSSTSSKLDSEYDNNKSFGDSAAKLNSTGSIHILLNELRELSSNQRPDTTLQKIIFDLEHALRHNFPAQHQTPDLYSVSDVSNQFLGSVFAGTDLDSSPQRIIDTCIVKPLLSNTKVEKSTSTTHLSEADEGLSNVFTKRHVRESCDLLEHNCERMHAICQQLRLERDHLKLNIEKQVQKLSSVENNLDNKTVQMDLLRKELEKRNEEIGEILTKEKNYIELIIDLRSERDSLSETVTKLRSESVQLHEDNRLLPLLRETQAKRCRSAERLRTQLRESEKSCQLLKLEREKLQVMNVAKDNELERLKREISEISSLRPYEVTRGNTNTLLDKLKLIGNGSHFDTLASELLKLIDPKLSNVQNHISNHSSSYDTIHTVPTPSTKIHSVPGLKWDLSDVLDSPSKAVAIQDTQHIVGEAKSRKESKNSVKACVDSSDSSKSNGGITMSELMTTLFDWVSDASSSSSHNSATRDEEKQEKFEDAKSTNTTLSAKSVYFKNVSEIVETGSRRSLCSEVSSLNFSVSDIEVISVRK